MKLWSSCNYDQQVSDTLCPPLNSLQNFMVNALTQGLEVVLSTPQVTSNPFSTAARQLGQPRTNPLASLQRPSFLPNPLSLDGGPIFQDGAAQQGAGVSSGLGDAQQGAGGSVRDGNVGVPVGGDGGVAGDQRGNAVDGTLRNRTGVADEPDRRRVMNDEPDFHSTGAGSDNDVCNVWQKKIDQDQRDLDVARQGRAARVGCEQVDQNFTPRAQNTQNRFTFQTTGRDRAQLGQVHLKVGDLI